MISNQNGEAVLGMSVITDDINQFPSPLVTVIMPIRNEAEFIERSLGSVLMQNYPVDRLQVIVADGLSEDGTRQIIQSLQKRHSNLELIDNPAKIVSTAINLAMMQAHGDVIVRVDGHTEIAPDYIRQCAAGLERTGADNIGGKMTARGNSFFGEVVSLATSLPFGVGGARFHYSDQEEWVDTVYMGAWPSHVFDRIGLFDEELVRDQDDEFNYRLREYGGRILLSPRIKSLYTVRSSPRLLWKQYYQYGFWKVRVLQKHPRQMRPRQFIPPLLVSGLILSLFLAPFFTLGKVILSLVFVSYLLANLSASLIMAARKNWKYLRLLPLVFAILHFSYGIGFLIGLVKFARRWGDKQGKIPHLDGMSA